MQSAPTPPPKTGRAAAAAAAAAALATAALPRMRSLQLKWHDLDRQHHLHLLLPAALGLFFAFFGGERMPLMHTFAPLLPPPPPPFLPSSSHQSHRRQQARTAL
jgi:hypothetical protein